MSEIEGEAVARTNAPMLPPTVLALWTASAGIQRSGQPFSFGNREPATDLANPKSNRLHDHED